MTTYLQRTTKDCLPLQGAVALGDASCFKVPSLVSWTFVMQKYWKTRENSFNGAVKTFVFGSWSVNFSRLRSKQEVS